MRSHVLLVLILCVLGHATLADNSETLVARDIVVDGLRMHIVEAGREHGGVPVILLHGFMVSSRSYGALQRRLARRYRVISVDAPGHGKSFRPARRLTACYAAVVTLRLLDRLRIERTVLVGHSMGGMTALMLAARWPQRVQQVIAINPAGFDPGVWQRRGMRLFFQPSVYASGPELAFWLTAYGSTMQLGEQGRADVAEQQRLRQQAGWARAMASIYRDIAAAPLAKVAPRIEVPITVLLSDHDGAFGAAYQRRLRQALPQANVQMVVGAGHNAHHDALDSLVVAIEAQLNTAATGL